MSKPHVLFSALLIAMATLYSGCQSSQGRSKKAYVKKAKILNEIPTHALSRNDWDTSANVMVYGYLSGVFTNTSERAQLLEAALQESLAQQGYNVIQPIGYMSYKTRNAVDKIIHIHDISSRQALVKGEKVTDWVAVLAVSPPNNAGNDEGEQTRVFEAWGRSLDGPPHKQLADNILNIDGFRDALEP